MCVVISCKQSSKDLAAGEEKLFRMKIQQNTKKNDGIILEDELTVGKMRCFISKWNCRNAVGTRCAIFIKPALFQPHC